MTADETDVPWPQWMLRYIGSDAPSALEDLVWSVGGSPPYGGVSYDEAAAVYELLESYHGPGVAEAALYDKVHGFLEAGSVEALSLDLFRCTDVVQSNDEDFGLETVLRGLEISRRLGHRGAEATFQLFEVDWHVRHGDERLARDQTITALETYLDLASGDDVYAVRVSQSAANAISLSERIGDVDRARQLLAQLADVIEPDLAEQIRVALSGTP